jgi:hypothetical protein
MLTMPQRVNIAYFPKNYQGVVLVMEKDFPLHGAGNKFL